MLVRQLHNVPISNQVSDSHDSLRVSRAISSALRSIEGSLRKYRNTSHGSNAIWLRYSVMSMLSNRWYEDGTERMVLDSKNGQSSMFSSRRYSRHGSHSSISGQRKIRHVLSVRISEMISNDGSSRLFLRSSHGFPSSSSRAGQISYSIFPISSLVYSYEYQISDSI